MTSVPDAAAVNWSGAAVAWRLVLTTAVLLPVVVLFGEACARLFLPLYAEVFRWIAPEFRLIGMAIVTEGADRVVRAEVTLDQIVIVGNRVFSPDPRGRAHATTLALNAMLGPATAIMTAVVWPARRALEVAWRALVLLPFAVLTMLADAPCVLAAELWAILLEISQASDWSALVGWKSFLQGGGRYAIGIALGVAAVLLCSPRRSTGRT